MSGPKPWSERSPAPFQGDGDPDGTDNGAHQMDPGEFRYETPESTPDSEGSGDVD